MHSRLSIIHLQPATRRAVGTLAPLLLAACVLTLAGQVEATESDTLVADLRAGQEVPPTPSGGRGCGVFRIDTVANTLSYYISFSGLLGGPGDETGAHIHGFAPPGVNAGVVHPLPLGNPKVGVWNYPQADEAAILDGRTYVNIHSNMFPGGEIRGQISSFMSPMDGFQENPSVATTGSGWGVFVINTTANTLRYHIVVESLGAGSMETAAHIHATAMHTVNAGVVHPLPAGSPKIGMWNYPEAMQAAILTGQTYVNVHTNNFPGGEIRGQIVNIVAPMDGRQEVPPNASTGAGCTLCSLDVATDRLSYYVHYLGLTGPETASHIHGYAPRGVNAGVVHPFPAGNPKKGIWNYPAANEPDILAGRTYSNIHTAMFPGGEIRGQIEFPAGKPCGDFDGDGDVDLSDFTQFQLCFGGSNVPPAPTCPPGVDADCDGDGDVDLSDFLQFQQSFTGSL